MLNGRPVRLFLGLSAVGGESRRGIRLAILKRNDRIAISNARGESHLSGFLLKLLGFHFCTRTGKR